MALKLWKTYLLIRRDLLEEFSYRFSFFIELGTIAAYACIFFFVAKVFAGASAPMLSRYHGDYFSFVLIGIAFMDYINTGLTAFTSTIRNEQMLGTLEVILATPTPLSLIFTARLIWNFIYCTLRASIYFAFGVLVLNADYAAANLAAIPVIVVLSVAAFNSLGMISAGFILVFKRGDPLKMFMLFATSLLGGVLFPIEVLPAALQKISAVLPVTYTLRLMRDACIRGASFAQLAPDLLVLAIICAILVPAGFWFFSYAVRRTKREGSITHY